MRRMEMSGNASKQHLSEKDWPQARIISQYPTTKKLTRSLHPARFLGTTPTDYRSLPGRRSYEYISAVD
jgi:hypothetical protein